MNQRKRRSYRSALVNHLIHLSKRIDDDAYARAAFAELRCGLNQSLRIAKHVCPFLPARRSDADENRDIYYYAVAWMFAWHRGHCAGVSLGDGFRQLRNRPNHETAESRLLEVLSSRPQVLTSRLHHAVRLLASHDISLDWHLLLYDMLHWSDPGKPIQRELAREYYSDPDTIKSGDTEQIEEGESDED